MENKEKETNYDEPIVTVKHGNHRFRFYLVPTNGSVEFTVDGEPTKNKVKEIRDNRAYLKNTLELFIGDDIEFIDSIKFEDMDFATLKAEQNILLQSIKQQKDRVRDWTLENKTKKELFSMIDKYSKRVRTRKVIKGGVKTKEKYAIHSFKIGSENIRMIERIIDDKVIVNPDYKVRTDFKRAGGIGTKEGELMVWKYYYEKDEPSDIDPSHCKGFWETAREMRYSERICFEIIRRYGVFAKKNDD